MNPSERIDKQRESYSDWRGEIFSQLRTIVNEASSDLEEGWKWDTAVWSHNGLVCAIGVFKNSVKLNFFQGASLDDPNKLFNAGLDAKKTRAIEFSENGSIDIIALTELIKTAVAFNSSKKK